MHCASGHECHSRSSAGQNPAILPNKQPQTLLHRGLLPSHHDTNQSAFLDAQTPPECASSSLWPPCLHAVLSAQHSLCIATFDMRKPS